MPWEGIRAGPLKESLQIEFVKGDGSISADNDRGGH
jgi:hypothetical protein